MDLLKTLLFYMIMTSAGATLESGATPIPYEQLSTPTPVVTATPTPSPTPTATPTATPSLYTLNVGSRGTNVRILQQKLMEMGYLTGGVDGIYGNQTRDAVIAFQQRNDLEADGIAGPQTLNKLYNDPAAIPARGAATPTPTAAPTQVPAAARVTIQYQTVDGETLAIDAVLCYAGETRLQPRQEMLPAGYRAVQNSQSVLVTESGLASPSVITFLCEPIQGEVTVQYLLQDGTLLASQTLSYLAGTHTLTADDTLVPAGSKLLNQRLVAFSINEEGIASPATIVFIYEPTPEVIAVIPAATAAPTTAPTTVPTVVPTNVPTTVPTVVPTTVPTTVPTVVPTTVPTTVPTIVPTTVPTTVPTVVPTNVPTTVPTVVPTNVPTTVPTVVPTNAPTTVPTVVPTNAPTTVPTVVPTNAPTTVPTVVPTNAPTTVPAVVPTNAPTTVPTVVPTNAPTTVPTEAPSPAPAPTDPAPTPGVTIEISSDLPVHYCLGNQIIAETLIPLPRQDMLVYPDPSLLPEGYELVSMNAQSLLADALPDVVVFEVQEIFQLCGVEIIYESTDGQLLASERRSVSTLDRTVTPDLSLVPAPYTLSSASPVVVPFEQIINQSPDHVVFRFEQLILTPSSVCVTVNGKALNIPFLVDEQHRLYLPLQALSAALLLPGNTEDGFSCNWQGHELVIRCEMDRVAQVAVDGTPIDMSDTLLVTRYGNDIYATVTLFEQLGYALSDDHTQLISIQ